MNSRVDLNLEAYLLSVIQRICKYPLLLKQLLKYSETPEHKRGAADALAAMLEVRAAGMLRETKIAMLSLRLMTMMI